MSHCVLRLRVPGALIAAAVLATACGSTVQTRGTATIGSGLGAPDGSTLDGSTGTSGTTGTTGTPGLGGSSSSSGTTGTTVVSGSTSTSGSTGSTVVPGTTSGTTGSAAPVTASGNHDPIQIGFIGTAVGNAAAAGIGTGQSYSDAEMYKAIVGDYNEHGGIDGHKIVPVVSETDTNNNNWSVQFSEVCANFTQDHHVKVVIGYVFEYATTLENCLTKNKIPHLYGGYAPGDLVDQAQHPTIVGTGHPSLDGASLIALDGALRTGLFTSKTKLGVLLDTCADGGRAYQRSVEPWLKAHKVSFRTVLLNCAQGATDAASIVAAVDNAELQFASSGINLVFAPGVAIYYFMLQAQNQGYHPEYLAGTGGAALQTAGAPASQMQHVHAFGWMPTVDVDQHHQPYTQTAAQKACIARLTRHNVKPAGYNDFMAAYQTCDGLELYAKALTAGKTTDASRIVSGVLAALPTFTSTITYGGKQATTGIQRGGPAVYRGYSWTASCSCLEYKGPTYPVPSHV